MCALVIIFCLLLPFISLGVKAPKRVSFFLWTAAWGRILTIDNLVKR